MDDVNFFLHKESVKLLSKKIDNFHLNEKIVCFISEWEGEYTYNIQNNFSESMYYKLKEKYFFNLILKIHLLNKYENKYSLRYKINRYVDSVDVYNNKSFDELDDPFEDIYENLYKNKLVSKIKKMETELECLSDDTDFIISNADCSPNKEDLLRMLDYKMVDVLCIDYEYFNKSFLFKIAQDISSQDKMSSFVTNFIFCDPRLLLKYFSILNNLKKNGENKEEFLDFYDSIQFESSHMYKQLNIPNIWETVKANGGILNYENNHEIIKGFNSDENIHIFYSLKSLLTWELYHTLKQKKRCLNCDNVLPENYKGKYCKKDDNITCHRERNKKRQKKYYNQSLTKI